MDKQIIYIYKYIQTKKTIILTYTKIGVNVKNITEKETRYKTVHSV